MVLNMLFDNYDLLMDSPNSTVKMRKLILQLAVQGKLVDQDSKDEPASELLKRIKAEKKKLITEGKIKKQKPLLPITEDEILYELPQGWEWARLGDICNQITDGTHHTPHYVNQGVPFLSVKDISKGKIDFSNTRFVTKEEHEKLIKRCKPEFENILFTKVGTTGIAKVVDVNVEFSIFVSVALLKFSKDKLYPYFWEYLLNSPLARKQSAESTQGIGNKNLVIRDIARFLIPIPPLTEQKRIVSKIDQLMQLCDQLDACQKKASRKYELLNDAALERLLSAKNIEEFAEHWQFLCDNFDLIYNDPAHANKLRQAILQLAVQGKLAPQDPNDEPASELLKRIKAEKEKLIAEGKIKKQKPLRPIAEDEILYELPQGWEWVRLGSLTQLITKGSSPKWQGIQYVGSDGGLLFLTSKNVGNYNLILDDSSFVEWKFNEIEPRSILQNGDILMNIVGASIGRTALYALDEIANINQAVCLIRFLNSFFFDKRYFLHFFNSPVCISYMFDKQVDMARPNLSMGNIERFLIPVPPSEEQKRIVTKVDQLMQLCDELEDRLNQSQKDSETLMQTVLHEAFS